MIRTETAPRPPCPYRFTVEEYHRLGETGFFQPEDRVELLNGEIILMSPIGIRHVQAVTWLVECLVEQARRRYMVSPGNPVWLSDISEPQPDLMLVPRTRRMKHHPQPKDVFLLLEVSDTSLAYDRDAKLKAYAEAKVREYWIVDLQGDAVDVYRRPSRGRYTASSTFSTEDVIHPLAFPDVAVPVRDIIPPRP
jgi:Uma2 family endonuclease